MVEVRREERVYEGGGDDVPRDAAERVAEARGEDVVFRIVFDPPGCCPISSSLSVSNKLLPTPSSLPSTSATSLLFPASSTVSCGLASALASCRNVGSTLKLASEVRS